MAMLIISGPPEDEAKEFYARQGRAIARWAMVEANVFRVFLLGLGDADRDAASAAYHTITAFNTRLGMVNAAFMLRYQDNDFSSQWATLSNRASKLSKDRNQLAHWVVAGSGSEPHGKRIWLTQNSDNVMTHQRVTGKPRQRLYADDLFKIEQRFAVLANDIFALCEAVAA